MNARRAGGWHRAGFVNVLQQVCSGRLTCGSGDAPALNSPGQVFLYRPSLVADFSGSRKRFGDVRTAMFHQEPY